MVNAIKNILREQAKESFEFFVNCQIWQICIISIDAKRLVAEKRLLSTKCF